MATDYNHTEYGHRWALATEIKMAVMALGFTPKEIPGTAELVLSRTSGRLKGVEVLVYTTIVGETVRPMGVDAIRVCAVFNPSEEGKRGRGILKERKVLRTGKIEEIPGRVVERVKDIAGELNDLKHCNRCGAPGLISKAGNLYCADACWTRVTG
jgi:hypothetical protein